MKKYLDKEGLEYFNQKIGEKIDKNYNTLIGYRLNNSILELNTGSTANVINNVFGTKLNLQQEEIGKFRNYIYEGLPIKIGLSFEDNTIECIKANSDGSFDYLTFIVDKQLIEIILERDIEKENLYKSCEVNRFDIASSSSNLLNGIADGSLRTIGAAEESESQGIPR